MSHGLSPGLLPPPTHLKSHPFGPRDTHLSQALTPLSAHLTQLLGPACPGWAQLQEFPGRRVASCGPGSDCRQQGTLPRAQGPGHAFRRKRVCPAGRGFPDTRRPPSQGSLASTALNRHPVEGKPRPSHRITGHSPEALGVLGGQSWLSGLLLPLAGEAA